tara:strand:+ start:72 stop:440 length:369 start_codon:yes stop_codon:yes gene_type:complete
MADPKWPDRDIAETAYWLRTLRRYGTDTKALAALRRRKAMAGRDVNQVRQAFSTMLHLHERTEELVADVLHNAKRSFHPQLTRAQFDTCTIAIRNKLIQEFPDMDDAIGYMVAMLWHMPYVR